MKDLKQHPWLTGTPVRGGQAGGMFSLSRRALTSFVAEKPVRRLEFHWHLGCYGWRVEFNWHGSCIGWRVEFKSAPRHP